MILPVIALSAGGVFVVIIMLASLRYLKKKWASRNSKRKLKTFHSMSEKDGNFTNLLAESKGSSTVDGLGNEILQTQN